VRVLDNVARLRGYLILIRQANCGAVAEDRQVGDVAGLHLPPNRRLNGASDSAFKASGVGSTAVCWNDLADRGAGRQAHPSSPFLGFIAACGQYAQLTGT